MYKYIESCNCLFVTSLHLCAMNHCFHTMYVHRVLFSFPLHLCFSRFLTCLNNAFVVYRYRRILVLVSHSQDFMNGVCTNIVHLQKNRLQYYRVW